PGSGSSRARPARCKLRAVRGGLRPPLRVRLGANLGPQEVGRASPAAVGARPPVAITGDTPPSPATRSGHGHLPRLKPGGTPDARFAKPTRLVTRLHRLDLDAAHGLRHDAPAGPRR